MDSTADTEDLPAQSGKTSAVQFPQTPWAARTRRHLSKPGISDTPDCPLTTKR